MESKKNQDKIIAFLPCRRGSERIPQKNIKPFAGKPGGLTAIKIEQLLSCSAIDEIAVSTDDEDVMNIAKSFDSNKVRLFNRPPHLALSSTSTDEVIKYVPEIITDGHVLWTHVTSPFFNGQDYNEIISKYISSLKEGFDSLMSVTRIQTFLWDNNKAVNYQPEIEKWPRTQTLPPLYEVNSGAFLAHVNIYKELHNRIGNRPFLFETDSKKGFDIDWPDDFSMAELMYLHGKI